MKPHILLAMPSPGFVPVQFLQSVCNIFADAELQFTPYLPPGTVIHLARDDALKLMRQEGNPFTHLCFLDTDQVVSSLTLRRLVRWTQTRPVHVVAPTIVQRNGEPFPVCYMLVGQSADGMYRYQEQSAAVAAYLSQFRGEWLTRSPSPVLPLQPEFPADMAGIPEAIRTGLHDPLMPVDAVGTGMVLLTKEACLALEPDERTGLLCDFANGGEDFSLMRKLLAAGYQPYVDRGCHVGHLTAHSRGPADMWEWHMGRCEEEQRKEEEEKKLPPVLPDLLNELAARKPQPWDSVVLPEVA